MERNETQRKTAKQGTWSLRVAACRYAAVLRLTESGLSGEADLKRALDDLERAMARARKARAGMIRAILMAAVLAIAACGGSPADPSAQDSGAQDPRDPRASAVCETNLDAGTPCDPCPGAISSEQIESPEWTTRRCGCRLANGGIAYVAWVSCGLPAAAENTCAKMLEVWNNSLCVH